MFHEILCITLLLFHFVSICFSISVPPFYQILWRRGMESFSPFQVLASDYRSRAGLHALRAKNDTVLLIANVHLQGWAKGDGKWKWEAGKCLLGVRSSPFFIMFHPLDVDSIDCRI